MGYLNIILDPDSFLAEWKNKSFLVPFAIVFVVALLASFTAYITAPAHSEMLKKTLVENGLSQDQAEAIAEMNFYSTVVMAAVMTFIVWLVLTAILYGISALFDGKGNFKTLLKLTAFSYIPSIIVFPVNAYIAREEATKMMIYGLKWMATLNSTVVASVTLSIVVTIWQAVYWTFAVKNARELELKKAAITSGILLSVIVIIEIISLALLAIHGQTY